MVGYLLGRCLRPVVRDRLERGFDELGATLLPLSRPAGRPAVTPTPDEKVELMLYMVRLVPLISHLVRNVPDIGTDIQGVR